MHPTLIAIAILLILLSSLLLLAPVRLRMNLCKKEQTSKAEYSLTWLGIAVKKGDIWAEGKAGGSSATDTQSVQSDASQVYADQIDEMHPERETAQREKTQREKEDDSLDSALPIGSSLLRAAPAAAAILIDLLRKIHLHNFYCRICFGLDDPAATAIASGCLWSIAWAAGNISSSILEGVSIQPSFHGERLEGELLAEIEGRPVYALCAAVQAFRVREMRRLFRVLMRWH